MRDIEYVYAVARIRCNENNLFNTDKLDQLVTAADYSEAFKRLGDMGYDTRKTDDLSAVLKNEQQKAWDLLCEIAPDKSELEFLTVRNSFKNLKAALKSVVSGVKADEFFIEPANVSDETIIKAVTEKDFSSLPDYMRGVAKECYDILTQLNDGQLSDSVIDKKALETYLEFSNKTKNDKLIRLADFTVAVSDMKIAYRAAKTGKDADYLDRSLAECKAIDISVLKKAALEGSDKVIECLEKIGYKDAAELLSKSSVAFEKWCDDFVLSSVINAKYEAFGFLPLVGYYLAKENEIKNVRIIMAAKENDISQDVIRERVRMLYV